MLHQELREWIVARSEVRSGFSRPDWDLVRADAQLAGEDFEKLAPAAARMWMETVASEFGSGAKVHDEGSLTYALLPENEVTHAAQRWLAYCCKELRVFLAGIVPEQESHLVVLLFDNRDAFASYVADLHEDVGDAQDEAEQLAHFGSNFYAEGFPQIVASLVDGGSQAMLAHDLTGSMLQHLELPAWLYSGIVQSMTGLLTKRDMRPSASDMTAARRYWNAESMQKFWAGASFSDSYATRPAHTMAYLFVQALSGSYERLVRLVTSAALRREDAGDAAFRAEYGHGLEHLAARVLGEGLWAPNREAIVQIRADIESDVGGGDVAEGE